jgi:hypothetical protein
MMPANIAHIVILNDNILSECANYLEYSDSVFAFLCIVSLSPKVCTIDKNPICGSKLHPYLSAANFITYLVSLVAGPALVMSSGAESRQQNTSLSFNICNQFLLPFIKPIYYENQDHVNHAAIGILRAGICAAGG